MAAFQVMHASPAKHSDMQLSRTYDYQTDRNTQGQTDIGQRDPYVPLYFAGNTKTPTWAHLHVTTSFDLLHHIVLTQAKLFFFFALVKGN